MKKPSSLLKVIAAAALFLLLAAAPSAHAFAQNQTEVPPPADAQQDNPAQSWKELLGLTPDQMGKIRDILEQNKLERQTARRRVNQAQRALDQAIYSDDATEAIIDQRVRELVEAQAVEARIRAMTELGIRRVLTPEQLNTFRKVRQQMVRDQVQRRLENGNQQRPLNKRLENGIGTKPARDRNADRVEGANPAGRNANAPLGPRRNILPRRIRP